MQRCFRILTDNSWRCLVGKVGSQLRSTDSCMYVLLCVPCWWGGKQGHVDRRKQFEVRTADGAVVLRAFFFLSRFYNFSLMLFVYMWLKRMTDWINKGESARCKEFEDAEVDGVASWLDRSCRLLFLPLKFVPIIISRNRCKLAMNIN